MIAASESLQVLLVNTGAREADSWLWLDRVCNGLLSWARLRGLFDSARTSRELVLLVPECSSIHRAYVWCGKGTFPWDALPPEAKHWTLHRAGEFSNSELSAGREKFGEIVEWDERSAPRLILEGQV